MNAMIDPACKQLPPMPSNPFRYSLRANDMRIVFAGQTH
ncbi:hypothetical protein ALSL_0321 [Aerosticca soli]|uniref:Uncharacterized protein n=1 Tax=Aerosticca soli TaxID=2010829 RepID=A0A2Z6E1U7_9GAMM|nr:hypothetical protein ALSL_0321 [Aerosticca soli]